MNGVRFLRMVEHPSNINDKTKFVDAITESIYQKYLKNGKKTLICVYWNGKFFEGTSCLEFSGSFLSQGRFKTLLVTALLNAHCHNVAGIHKILSKKNNLLTLKN